MASVLRQKYLKSDWGGIFMSKTSKQKPPKPKSRNTDIINRNLGALSCEKATSEFCYLLRIYHKHLYLQGITFYVYVDLQHMNRCQEMKKNRLKSGVYISLPDPVELSWDVLKDTRVSLLDNQSGKMTKL